MALVNPTEPDRNHLSIFDNIFVLKEIYLNGKINIAKEFLTNSAFDARNDKYQAFKIASQQKKYELLKFIIFDLDLEKTENISQFMRLYNCQDLETMFNSRDLNKSLNQKLNNSNQALNKKMKI
jgi:hypothetical protein